MLWSVLFIYLFIKHTSASLTINENADPTVRADFESHFNTFVPERAAYYQHDYEGDDDMPAHLKSSILGDLTPKLYSWRLNKSMRYTWIHAINEPRNFSY
jgi:hypothetical protein